MHTRGRNTDDSDADEALEAEAVNQLHDLDDRRDAAEMRVEELVRDTEYAEDLPVDPPRGRRWIWVGVGLVGAILYALMRLFPT